MKKHNNSGKKNEPTSKGAKPRGPMRRDTKEVLAELVGKLKEKLDPKKVAATSTGEEHPRGELRPNAEPRLPATGTLPPLECARLTEDLGLARSTVHQILAASGLQPHRIRTFTFSSDPDFEAKLLDVVGLYLNPPQNALVLCVDEKTGIQALDRTQPLLPLSAKKPRNWTSEYVRHGTQTLLGLWRSPAVE